MALDIEKYKEKVKSSYNALSKRERVLLVLGVVGVVGIAFYLYGILTVLELFSSQSKRMADVKQALDVTPDMLARYGKLLGRRKEIESFYDKINLKEAPLTHIENLLKTKANATPGSYTVQPRAFPDFAGKYEHTGFIIKFTSSNLDSLVTFLRELTKGQQPMLLTQINIERQISSNTLSVTVEVSGFQRSTKEGPQEG